LEVDPSLWRQPGRRKVFAGLALLPPFHRPCCSARKPPGILAPRPAVPKPA
jgi:hypothetical protein